MFTANSTIMKCVIIIGLNKSYHIIIKSLIPSASDVSRDGVLPSHHTMESKSSMDSTSNPFCIIFASVQSFYLKCQIFFKSIIFKDILQIHHLQNHCNNIQTNHTNMDDSKSKKTNNTFMVPPSPPTIEAVCQNYMPSEMKRQI